MTDLKHILKRTAYVSCLASESAKHSAQISENVLEICSLRKSLSFMDKVNNAQARMIRKLEKKLDENKPKDKLNIPPDFDYIPPSPAAPILIRQGKRGFYDPLNKNWVKTYEEAYEGAKMYKKMKIKK